MDASLYNLTKNMNIRPNRFPKFKMGQTDCPMIAQPELLITLPNKQPEKKGGISRCHLTPLLTNGQQVQEIRGKFEEIKWECEHPPVRFLINLGLTTPSLSVFYFIQHDENQENFRESVEPIL